MIYFILKLLVNTNSENVFDAWEKIHKNGESFILWNILRAISILKNFYNKIIALTSLT